MLQYSVHSSVYSLFDATLANTIAVKVTPSEMSGVGSVPLKPASQPASQVLYGEGERDVEWSKQNRMD